MNKVRGQRDEEPTGNPNFEQVGNCERCFRYTDLNENGECEDCVLDNHLSNLEDQAAERRQEDRERN